MNPIKFYDTFLYSSYVTSSFLIKSKKNIYKLNNIEIKIIFKSINKITPIISFLNFSIITKTKPFFLTGLKNYKENKINLKGLNFFINKNKYNFLFLFINEFLIENRDAIKKVKKEPKFFTSLILDKFLIHNSVDNIFDLCNISRNSQNINIQFSFNTKENFNNNQTIYLFNSLISNFFLPKVLK